MLLRIAITTVQLAIHHGPYSFASPNFSGFAKYSFYSENHIYVFGFPNANVSISYGL